MAATEISQAGEAQPVPVQPTTSQDSTQPVPQQGSSILDRIIREFGVYKKGRAQPSDCGELEAAFDGKHGWFWRNRTTSPVTDTLKTSGAYGEIKRMM
ncbi:hypothetical protein [Neorhizobium sp. T6_25]|uniref:hypothetical protein n=1 Tax=Neorhizobium sp. T6_25 TaxID=2093833 RepID=UPI00197B901B|nr:hypothetical protein [Neorhizobium sp. T6_25]